MNGKYGFKMKEDGSMERLDEEKKSMLYYSYSQVQQENPTRYCEKCDILYNTLDGVCPTCGESGNIMTRIVNRSALVGGWWNNTGGLVTMACATPPVSADKLLMDTLNSLREP